MKMTNISKFIAIVIAVNMIIYHIPLFTFAINDLDITSLNGIMTFVTMIVVVVGFSAIILISIGILVPFLLKPFCMLMAILNSMALYFIVTYRIILDKSMIENIFNTRFSESTELFHPTLLIYLVFLGVVPAWLIWRVRLVASKRLELLMHMIIVVIVSGVFIYMNSTSWLWIDKNAKRLGGRILPWSYVSNTIRIQVTKYQSKKVQVLLPTATLGDTEKVVIILVIGETARLNNFSLYGYERKTNPYTEKVNIIAMNNPVACSTYTTASVACMLSHSSDATKYEPLPSYVYRSGVDVIWRSRNWGEPKINTRLYQEGIDLKKHCSGEKCNHDEVLLSSLAEEIENSDKEKILVVLHTKGSHGPLYSKKYPKQFEVFKPVCESVALDTCSKQELINAYDNSIVYTDYFLSQTIKILQSLKQTSSTMLYISDHGESLGEHGLYLHGVPFSFAPEEQKNIPFLVWMSERFMKSKAISITDFKQREGHSHQNIFHSVLGAFNVKSEVYDEAFDVFYQKPQ